MDLAIGVVVSFGIGVFLAWLLRTCWRWLETLRSGRTPGAVSYVKGTRRHHMGGSTE